MNENWQRDMVQGTLAEIARVNGALEEIQYEFSQAVKIISEGLRQGKCLIVFGNGGSAAQAEHLVAELVGRFERERAPIGALALTCGSSVLTAVGNDYGFEEVFTRQLRALARPGDIVLAISTSGNSRNVLRALEVAHEKKLRTIGLTGRHGGQMRERVDLCLCVPSDSTPRIQEAHLIICHILCSLVERSVLPNDSRD